MSPLVAFCSVCRKVIDTNNQVYYVFLDRTDNIPFCVECYLENVKEMRKRDPFITPIYQKNFVRMNK